MKCLFSVYGDTLKLFYLRVLKNLLHVVFIALISHYWKLRALYKLISIVLATIDKSNQVKISRKIKRCQGYFLKNALRTRLLIFPQFIIEKIFEASIKCRRICFTKSTLLIECLNEDKDLLSKSWGRGNGEKETVQCHTGLPTKTFNNRWQYFVIECRCLGFSCLSKFWKISFPRKRKTKLGTFNITLKLNSLVLLKKMKNCISSHLFLDTWLQMLSSCYVLLSDWLTELKISVYYETVHLSTTNEIIFTK